MRDFATLIAVIVVIVAAFLLFREIILWYWRVNHIVERLDQILSELKRISGSSSSPKE